MFLRHAWRALRAAPATTAFCLLILTVGIGSATTAFSVVDAVLLRSLPFEQADRLVYVSRDGSPSWRRDSQNHSWASVLAWREHADALESVAATSVGPYWTVSTSTGVEYRRAWRATANFFEVLKVRPILGRSFTAEDEAGGGQHVAVITHDLWQRFLGADPNVLGRSLRLTRSDRDAGTVVRIVGVMQKEFAYPLEHPWHIWLPYGRGDASVETVIARLRQGRTIAEAQAQVRTLGAAAELAAGRPLRDDWRPVLRPFFETLVADVRHWLWLAFCAAGLIMAVACANVASIQLARSAGRARELAVRASLGASPRRLVGELLTENVMLSLAAALLGALVAWWGVAAAKAVLPAGIPRAETIAVDLRVLLTTVMTAVGAALFFGVAPAWQAARTQPGSLLNNGVTSTPRGGRGRTAFVAAQVGLVSALLVISALFVGSYVRVARADLGFSRSNVVTLELPDLAPARAAVLEAVARTPGVTSVAEISGAAPLVMAAYGGVQTGTLLRATEQVDEGFIFTPTVHRVSPNYFSTAGVRLLRGRAFTPADAAAQVAILDELSIRVLFPDGRNPIGERVWRGTSEPALTIVGVVSTVSVSGPEQPSGTQLYLPATPGWPVKTQLVASIRSSSVTAAIGESLRRALPAGAAHPTIHSLDGAFDKLTTGRRANARLMLFAGVVVLLLGGSGVYAMLASLVAQRRRELGVRIALGATGAQIVRWIASKAGVPLAAGLLIGLPLGGALSVLFASLLFGVEPTDASTYVFVAGLLLTAGILAAWVPARRASRIDPIETLRAN